MAIKKKEYENLSANNISHVIALLNPIEGSSITKKEACAILNISYNTTRLTKIIQEHEEKQAYIADRKAHNRGKRASPEEITQVVNEYLQGEPISEIAKGLFRSSGFVKGIIERIGVPFRPTGEEKRTVAILPEECIKESFKEGEIVWSAKYHAPAIVVKECEETKYKERYNSKCYQISVIEKVDSEGSFFSHIQSGGFNAFQLAYDLGDLSHLEQYGVQLDRL